MLRCPVKNEEKETVLTELETVIHRLGIDLEYRRLTFEGGLCFIQKKPHIILNRDLPSRARARHLARILHHFNLEGIFLSDRARTFLAATPKSEPTDDTESDHWNPTPASTGS